MGEPVRTCLGCRRRAEQRTLVRVVAQGREIRVDPRRTLAGRGAYVHPDARCVEQAVRRRAFPRALRSAVDNVAAGLTVAAFLSTSTPSRHEQPHPPA